MMPLSEAATILRAAAVAADRVFTGVSTDTRTLNPGDLFVAIRGEHYDGHRFVSAAAAAGAAAALVDSAGAVGLETALPLLVVGDTRLALGRLAAHWRSRFALPLVALTGSSGKTSVKEMLAAIFREATLDNVQSAQNAVLATRGNLNNDIGVPLMLLELTHEHRYAVIEMGMNHEGEIRYLTELAAPDVALVTNAGSAHIEFLGSHEAIARAKGEIFEGLGVDGAAVINADDRFAPLWRALASGKRVIDFALDQNAAVTGSYRLRGFESEIVLRMPSGEATAHVAAPGVHNVRNAVAAAAAAAALEIPAAVIAAGLGRYTGIKGRLQTKRAAGGAVVVDDTYNANPESARAAIDVLAQARGRRIFVFGDMGELGPHAPGLHAAVGAHAKASGIETMLTLGELSTHAAQAFGAGARHHDSVDSLVSELESALGPDVTVLVKGSRFMRMERVVAALVDAREAGGGRGEVQQQ